MQETMFKRYSKEGHSFEMVPKEMVQKGDVIDINNQKYEVMSIDKDGSFNVEEVINVKGPLLERRHKDWREMEKTEK